MLAYNFSRLDKLLNNKGISCDELVEVCGASGSGKTYFCLKLVSLALLEKNVAAIYIDTSNYVNSDNMTLVLRVSLAFESLILTLSKELHYSKRQTGEGRDCKRSPKAPTRDQDLRPGAAARTVEFDSFADEKQTGEVRPADDRHRQLVEFVRAIQPETATVLPADQRPPLLLQESYQTPQHLGRLH